MSLISSDANRYGSQDASSRPFVPRRHSTRSVFKSALIESSINGERCDLQALNFTNMSASSRTEIEVGQEARLVIKVMGAESSSTIFDEVGTVIDSVSDTFGSEFDVQFSDFVDVEKLSREAGRIFKRQVLGEDLRGSAENLPPEYALLSVELLHHLSGLRLKADLLEEASDGTLENIYADAKRLMSSHSDEFRELWYRFNDVIADIPYEDDRFHAIKWHTDRVLKPMFMGAPVFERSYIKPLGYPGDYQIMLYAYDSHTPIKTPTLYDAVLQQYFSHGFGACIRSRMELTVNAIHANMAKGKSDRENPYEILNVGCGAAVELPALISDNAAGDQFLDIHLLDQDDRPLQYAFQHAAVAMRDNKHRCSVTAFNMSFLELYRAGRLTKDKAIGDQNVVYSLGLLDYFKPLRAKRFVEALYERVKPGGLLAVCNVAKTRVGCEWILECLTDWRLEYRTLDEMNTLFSDLPDSPKVTIRLEESQQMWVAVVEKPE